MLWLFVALMSAAPTPGECEGPAVCDVAALQAYAQKSGSLSVGLDSVATWCFDSAGDFTGGAPKSKKPPKIAPALTGDCAKALTACEIAKKAVTPELKALLTDALSDLQRPFRQKVYVPKRSGLADHPGEVVECASHSRPDLFAQAQARMDVARLASQTFNEYANYRTWLYAEGLKCTQAVNAGKVDTTQRNTSLDSAPTPAPPVVLAPVPPVDQSRTVLVPTPEPALVLVTPASALDAGSSTRVVITGLPSPVVAPASDAGGPAVAEPVKPLPIGGPSSERERVAALPPIEKWGALAQVRSTLELHRDYTLGFLASRELRDCRCQRPNPTGLAQRYAKSDNLPQLEVDETKNAQCELCLHDAFAAWKTRVEKQCALVDKLSDFEVGVLQRSDDGNGLPPRCIDTVTARRDGGVAAPVAMIMRDGGLVRVAVATPLPLPPAPVAKPAAPAVPTFPVMQPVATPLADTFSRASDWAPIPLREDGRLYVRLFMSSACAADVLPGPIQARTGDLLVIPFNARQLSVRSPCGGLAEVYWGREVKPRVSEIFARNQPLHLQFQPQ